ncbi:hypothetical protein [Leptothoe sp. PORK10 BA2]|nr:hypothetical protein [Leptothoe sp. PORK10 BA2]
MQLPLTANIATNAKLIACNVAAYKSGNAPMVEISFYDLFYKPVL